jgi:hypothetical protein
MAASQSRTQNIDRYLAHTNEHIFPGVRHIVFQEDPFASIFFADTIDPVNPMGQMAGAGKRVQTGGERIMMNHGIEANTTAGWMSGPTAAYDTSMQDFVRRSEQVWKHGSATMTVSLTDKLINAGTDKVADIVTEEATNRLSSLVNVAVAGLISGTTSNQPTGIESLVSANDSVQGLSGAPYPTWNSRGLSPRGTAPASVSFAGASFATTGIPNWITAYNNACEGNRKPNVIPTTWDIFGFYENKLIQQERYAAPAMKGDAGSFAMLQFRTGPVLPSPNVTAGITLFLNTQSVYFVFLAGGDFQAQPWKDATVQEIQSSELVVKGNTFIEDRRLNNKVTSQVA